MGDMLSKNFSRSEFRCRCGAEGISFALVEILQKVRDAVGPMRINSSMRCPYHNNEAGGSPKSSHLIGLAVDIHCDNSLKRYKLISNLIKQGIRRIGIRSDFIHCDMDENKSQDVIWVYETYSPKQPKEKQK